MVLRHVLAHDAGKHPNRSSVTGVLVAAHADCVLVHPRSFRCSVHHFPSSVEIAVFLGHFICDFSIHVDAGIGERLHHFELGVAAWFEAVGSPGQKLECILKQTIRKRPFPYSNCSSSNEMKKRTLTSPRGRPFPEVLGSLQGNSFFQNFSSKPHMAYSKVLLSKRS